MLSEYRSKLLTLVFDFVETAIKINGISRIAIIGSLMTSKLKPKDVDLLLNISDDMDLTHLAKISRTLQGKSGSLTGGADVFLSNNLNEYIGRICIWKDCRLGVRMSCDAQNCGKRKYLHDDLQVIKLSCDLIKQPPLILYPNIVRNSEIPIDVENILLKSITKIAI